MRTPTPLLTAARPLRQSGQRQRPGRLPSAQRLRAVTVADSALHANALGMLLSTAPDIEVIASVANAVFGRETIVRTRPDVVIVRCADDELGRHRVVFDLQLDMPQMGFVLVLANRPGNAARRPPVDRAVVVLSSEFSLADLLTSVRMVGEIAQPPNLASHVATGT